MRKKVDSWRWITTAQSGDSVSFSTGIEGVLFYLVLHGDSYEIVAYMSDEFYKKWDDIGKKSIIEVEQLKNELYGGVMGVKKSHQNIRN